MSRSSNNKIGRLEESQKNLISCCCAEYNYQKISSSMNTGQETHRVKIKIHIRKITMNIKFPCSLTPQIKHDVTQESRKLYQLKNGECLMGETLESECEALYSPIKRRFEDKKININIFMVSMSGKVASGSVNFTLFGKEVGQINECMQFLEKCPDKQAKIYYSFSVELLRKERMDKTFYSDFKEEHIRKNQSFNSAYIPKGTFTPKEDLIKEFKDKRSTSPQNQNLNESIVEGVTALDSKSFRKEIRNQKKLNTLSLKQQISNKSGRSKSPNRVRQNFSSKNIQFPLYTPTERHKTQVYEDEQKQQLQKLRMKIRNLERSDKGATQALRQTKEEAERRRNKITQLQSTKFELEEALRVKDEKVKKLQKNLKQLSEQREDADNQLKSIKAQLDLRENINREQIKKWEEKYRQSESQREQITEQYNRALKTFEEGEKKYQGLLKEKQRAGLEEKGRINKKIDQQTTAFQELEKQNKDLKTHIEELSKEKKQIYDAYSGSESSLANTKSTIQVLNAKLKSENERIKKMQEQIQLFKASEVEKQQLKKKYHELTLTNGTLSQKNAKSQKTIQSLEAKLKEMEDEAQKRNNEKNQLNLRLSQLKKNYDNVKFNQEQKVRQSQSLSVMHETASSRILELKTRLQNEKRSFDQTQRDFSNKYNALLRQRDSLMSQTEELRWQMDKQLATINELSMQIRAQNQEIFRVNEQLLDKNEKLKKLEENNKQLTLSCDNLHILNTQLDKKMRQFQVYCKERQNESNEMKKKLDRSERECSDLKERAKMIEITTKDKYSDYQKRIKEKQDAIQAKINQIQILQKQNRESNDDCNNLRQSLSVAQQQIMHLKDLTASNRRELDGQQNLIMKLKESEAEGKRIIVEKQIQLKQKGSQIEKLTKKLQKAVEDQTSFKMSSTAALESFLSDLLREDENSPNTGQNLKNRNGIYPDQKIAALQIEYIQKHWQQNSKQRSKIVQLLQQKDTIEYQLGRVKLNLQQLTKKNENDILNQKEKAKLFYGQIAKREEAERERVHKFEEMLLEKEREAELLKSQISKLQEQNKELHSQMEVMMAQYDSIKEENKELEEKLHKHRSQQIKQRADWEGKIKETVELFEDQIANLKRIQIQSDKKTVAIEKQLADKVELLKKYEMQHNVLTYERDKKESKVAELAQRIQDYHADLKQNQKDIKQKERQLKKALELIDQLNENLRDEKEKYEQAMFKVQEQNHIILDLNKEIEKGREDLKAEQERLTDIQNQNKHRLDALRIINEKQSQQIKELKEKSISLSSELQLKKFMITQLEQSNKAQKATKQQLRSELEKKKATIFQMTEENTSLAFQVKQNEQKLSSALSQKDVLIGTIERLKQSINQMRFTMKEDQQNSEQVSKLQRQLDKMRTQKSETQAFYERSIQDLKNNLRQSKKMESSRVGREQELKKKLKIVQKLLENTHPDLSIEKSRFFKEIQKDRKQLTSKNDSLQSKIDQLEEQLSSLKMRFRRESEKYTRQTQSLRDQMTTKDFMIRNQQIQLQNLSFKINEIVNERSRVEAQLQKQKTKSKKIEMDLQNQQKSFREKMRKTQEEQIKGLVEDIEKRLESSRSRRMEGNFNELERVIVSGSYREIQQIVKSVSKEKRY